MKMKNTGLLMVAVAAGFGFWYWKKHQARALPGMTKDQATIPGSEQDQMIAAQNAGFAGLRDLRTRPRDDLTAEVLGDRHGDFALGTRDELTVYDYTPSYND